MSKLFYPAVIERGDDGAFGVLFPDLPGCFSAGDTADEAARMAEDALTLHLEVLADTGRPIPAASAVDAITVAPEVTEYARLLVGAEEPKAGERVNVWMQKTLLSRIDRYVADFGKGGSRSAFLSLAARQYLSREPADT